MLTSGQPVGRNVQLPLSSARLHASAGKSQYSVERHILPSLPPHEMPLPVPVLPDVDAALDALEALDAPPVPLMPPVPLVAEEELVLEVVVGETTMQPVSLMHSSMVSPPPQPMKAVTAMTALREPRKTRVVVRIGNS